MTDRKPLELTPHANVDRDGALYVAATPEPWLRVPAALEHRGRWARARYSASFLDPLIRPRLRLVFDAGFEEVLWPGAIHGRGEWVGFIPSATRDVLLSPVGRPGPFGFRIDACEALSNSEVARRALRFGLTRPAAAALARARRMGVEAMEHMGHALGHTPLSRYDPWRRDRVRPFDIAGLDRPRADWRRTPHVRMAVRAGPPDAEALARLLASLAAQPYPAWSVAAIWPPGDALPPGPAAFAKSQRLLLLAPDATARDLVAGLDPSTLIGRCDPRDSIPDHALAALAEHAAAHADEALIYADEDAVEADGRFHSPQFKPDWSPAFQSSSDYLGAAVFARARALGESNAPARLFADPEANIRDFLALDGARIGHLRRIVLSRAAPAARNAVSPARARVAGVEPLASVIIPTRDRVDLLRACVSSVLQKAGATPFEVIVIDNGSRKPATAAYLAELARDARFRVLARPGPFNFSALNNDAAARARAPVLLFLNSDTVALSDNWLDPLIALAGQHGVGAVGAKLVFASGRLQHAGVAIGLCGRADHIGAGLRADDPGYLRMMESEREVSAVTGACLAVAKATFEAVGGFDAVNLPVELNDVDLCLRLRERGLRNMITPASALIHHESASRGRMAQPSRKYAAERSWFIARWRDAIRDDPYFHPALSLHSTIPSLG